MVEVMEEEESELVQISVNAIVGITDYIIMKVKGIYGKKIIYVLIDFGFIYNFIDVKIANLLGCKL